MNVSEPNTCLAADAMEALCRNRGKRGVWEDDEGVRSWNDLGGAIEVARLSCIAAGVSSVDVVLTPGDATFDAIAWLFGAAAAGAIVAPLRAERRSEMGRWADAIEIAWTVEGSRVVRAARGGWSGAAAGLRDELRSRGNPGLILATGGTTGIPKLVLHDLAALLATVKARMGPPRRILPLMRFDHIGGLDTAWRALGGGHVLVRPPPDPSAEAVASAIERHQVHVLPATPSFLNLLLIAGVHRSFDLSSLRTVPYGAEPMPEGLLARLRSAFPEVAFVQRFGTSETGALPVREAGSGLELRKDESGFSWKIVEGELWVCSPARALGYLSGKGEGFDTAGWFRTGDLAEQTSDGGVRVLGRCAELINVGGEKVLPSEVEGALLAHPLVENCRVVAKPNAVLGQVVAAEVVWRGRETDPLKVKRMLQDFASGLLARHKLPVTVTLVAGIGATANFKKNRQVLA